MLRFALLTLAAWLTFCPTLLGTPTTRPARVETLLRSIESDLRAALNEPADAQPTAPALLHLVQAWQAMRSSPADTDLLDRAAALVLTDSKDVTAEYQRWETARQRLLLELCRRDDGAVKRELAALSTQKPRSELLAYDIDSAARSIRYVVGLEEPTASSPGPVALDLATAVRWAELSGRWERAAVLESKRSEILISAALNSGGRANVRQLARLDPDRGAAFARQADGKWIARALIDAAEGIRERADAASDAHARQLAEALIRESLEKSRGAIQPGGRAGSVVADAVSSADRWGFADLVDAAVRAGPVPDAPTLDELQHHLQLTISAANQGRRELAAERLSELARAVERASDNEAKRDGGNHLAGDALGRVELRLATIELLLGRTDEAKARSQAAVARFDSAKAALTCGEMIALRQAAVRVGEDGWALDLGKRLNEDEAAQSIVHREIVARDVRVGRLETAWRRAAELQGSRGARLGALAWVAVASEQSRRSDISSEWIDAHPVAADRAAVRLVVAYVLDGKAGAGGIYWFSPTLP